MSLVNEDLKLKIISGDPILLKKSNSFFYHRTIREVIQYGYINFLKTIQLFKYNKEDLEEDIPIPGMSVFFYFLLLLNNESSTKDLIQQGLYFFINAEKVEVNMERQILLCTCNGIENIEINEEGFEEIQNYIRIIYDGNFKTEDDEEDDSKLSEAERRMKDKFKKLKRMRETAKTKSGEEEGQSQFSDQLGGFWARNSNMRWSDVLDLPYYTFYFLLKKLQILDDYDIQLRAIFAGASIDNKELHHWLMGESGEDG